MLEADICTRAAIDDASSTLAKPPAPSMIGAAVAGHIAMRAQGMLAATDLRRAPGGDTAPMALVPRRSSRQTDPRMTCALAPLSANGASCMVSSTSPWASPARS